MTAHRIGIVLEQALAPVPGGTGRFAIEIAGALARTARVQVTGYVAAHRDIEAARVSGVRGPRRLALPRRGLIAAWERGIPTYFRGLDLLHAPTLLMPRRTNVPVIVTIHDAVPWTHPQTLTVRGAQWHKMQAEYAARHVAAICVPTYAVADELAQYLDIRVPVHVVGLGVSSVMASGGARLADLPERYLICVATLEPRKGLDIIISALADPRLRQVPLLVVGQPGWGGVDVEAAARHSGVDSGRIKVISRLDDAQLSRAIANADALVQPSRSEGFGLPVLEAMTLATPVVHSDVPALVEVTGGAGLMVPRGDGRALADALAHVWNDDHLRERLSTAGVERSKAYSWSLSALELSAIYDEIVGQSR